MHTLFIVSAVAGWMIAAQAAAAPAVAIDAKFDTATDHVLIPVEINGARLWCNLDSGFSALLALDRLELGRARLTEGPGQPTADGAPARTGDGGASANVQVGGVILREQGIIIRDFPAEAPDMDCVMGVGLLRRYVVELDYLAPRVNLYERASYTPGAGTREIPLIMRRHSPFVEVTVDTPEGPRVATLVADTGAAKYAAAFVGPFAAALAKMGKTAKPAQLPEPGGIHLLDMRLPGLTVGPLSMRDAVATIIESGLISGAIEDGLLGTAFLRQFTVAFDFDGSRMYLTPNRRFGQRQTYDASGIGWKHFPAAGEFVVNLVLPGSAGAAADVREGDRVLAVDGQAAASMTPVQLRQALSRSGASCTLRLLREGRTLDVVLTLRERL